MHEYTMTSRIMICVLLFSAGAALAGNFYRWVDSDGSVHYSDQPPPPSATDVQQIRPGANVIENNPSYVLEQAVKNSPVTLYANDCGEVCSKARQLLNKRGVPFTDRNPNQDPDSAEALKKISGELMVPVLVVGNSQTIKGFEENAWNNALDAAGYPRTPSSTPAASKSTKPPQANVPPPPPPSTTMTPPAPAGNY
jgi:glutaredoxin